MAEVVIAPESPAIKKLDADVYYVTADLTDAELRSLEETWERMNKATSQHKLLMVLPESLTLKQMSTDVVRSLMQACARVLRERGEELPDMSGRPASNSDN
jgi:hypothetical protein